MITNIDKLRIEFGYYMDDSGMTPAAQLYCTVLGEFDQDNPMAVVQEIAQHLLTTDIEVREVINVLEHPEQADGCSDGPTE